MRVLDSTLIDRFTMLALRHEICVKSMYMTNCISTHCVLLDVCERRRVVSPVVAGAVSLCGADYFIVIICAQRHR